MGSEGHETLRGPSQRREDGQSFAFDRLLFRSSRGRHSRRDAEVRFLEVIPAYGGKNKRLLDLAAESHGDLGVI